MFPAGAGMNRQNGEREPGNYHVPRRRGDEPSMYFSTILAKRCSPQARG